VVAFRSKYDKERRVARSMVKVLSMGDNFWRNIQCFDELSIYKLDWSQNGGVYLSGAIMVVYNTKRGKTYLCYTFNKYSW